MIALRTPLRIPFEIVSLVPSGITTWNPTVVSYWIKKNFSRSLLSNFSKYFFKNSSSRIAAGFSQWSPSENFSKNPCSSNLLRNVLNDSFSKYCNNCFKNFFNDLLQTNLSKIVTEISRILPRIYTIFSKVSFRFQYCKEYWKLFQRFIPECFLGLLQRLIKDIFQKIL